ncbi:MAG: MFS transporter [Candidatus Helarchaeota archaeon]
MISLGTIIGIFAAPIFGYLSDRTNSRLGKIRVWIIIFAPLTAILFWFISGPFFRESLIQSGFIFPYIIILFVIYSIIFNAMNIPYIGLMADITPED